MRRVSKFTHAQCNFTRKREKSKNLWKMARQSVGSFTSSSSSSVNASFISLASSSSSGSSSYEIESEVGREALREICCSALSRALDFPDSQLETLLGFEEEKGARGDEDSGTNVARLEYEH